VREKRGLRPIAEPCASAYRHKHLLREFLSRDIKGRFAGSAAGILWTLINPAANIVVYIFLFSLVLRIRVTAQETGTNSFVIFFLSGIFPWLMFSEGLSRAVGCLVENADLITKVVFPIELLPLSTILATAIVNGIGMVFFLLYLIPAGFLHASWLLLLFLIPAQVVFTWGLANVLAAGCVFLRDIREVLGILLLLWFYATPVIYPLSMVPKNLRPVIGLNPMGVFISFYRDILLLHHVAWHLIMLSGFFSIVSYVLGAWFFVRARPAFGDVL
jgi:lipopolysaccharide transport system permease protein